MKNRSLLLIVFLCTSFIIYGQSEDKATTIKLPEISKEIIAMRDEDQKLQKR